MLTSQPSISFADQGVVSSATETSNQHEKQTAPVFRTQNGSIVMPRFSKSLTQLNASWNEKQRQEDNAKSAEEPRYAGHVNNSDAWGVGMPPAASDGPVEFAGPFVAKK